MSIHVGLKTLTHGVNIFSQGRGLTQIFTPRGYFLTPHGYTLWIVLILTEGPSSYLFNFYNKQWVMRTYSFSKPKWVEPEQVNIRGLL